MEYLPPELTGSLPTLEELEELSRLSVSIDRRMHQTPLLKYLSKGRIVTQNHDLVTLFPPQLIQKKAKRKEGRVSCCPYIA